MQILNPHIVINNANWFLRLLGFKYTIHFAYAVEYETYDMRGASNKTSEWRAFKSVKSVLEHAKNIKGRVTGAKVYEITTNEFSQERDKEAEA